MEEPRNPSHMPFVIIGPELAMRYIIVRQHIYGENLNKSEMPAVFTTISDAMAEAERLARQHRHRGYNSHQSLWWGRDETGDMFEFRPVPKARAAA